MVKCNEDDLSEEVTEQPVKDMSRFTIQCMKKFEKQ